MSDCNHDCSSCSSNCSERRAESFQKPLNPYSSVKKVIGVVSGKGGVGKSLVTSLLASEMQRRGHRCAVLDADITGPSIPKSFGIHQHATGTEEYLIPVSTYTGLLGQGMSMDEIMRGIDKQGGLLGISGVSNDLRDIQDAAGKGNERAALAIEAFCDAVVKYIGAFYAELGGMDYLVFTGGIGENSVSVREKVCSRLACLGVKFDAEANRTLHGEGVISSADSPATVLVLPTNEEVGIAQTVFEHFGNRMQDTP